MKTLTVDDYRRVRLPNAKPRSKLAYQEEADGSIRLVPVKLAAAKAARVTNVDPLPAEVLREIYARPELDEAGVDQLIAVQPKGVRD